MNQKMKNLQDELYKNSEELSHRDGFKSTHLREKILSEISKLQPPETKNKPLDKKEKELMAFLAAAENLGIKIAKEEALEETRENTGETLKAFMLAGAEKIGRRLGCEYGLAMCGEMLIEKGMSKSADRTQDITTTSRDHKYGFSITTHAPGLKTATNVRTMPLEEKNNVLVASDGKTMETYVFPTMAAAEKALGKWELHIDDIAKDTPDGVPSPVKYAFTIEKDINDNTSVGSIFPLADNEDLPPATTMDGAVITTKLFDSLPEALTARSSLFTQGNADLEPNHEKTQEKTEHPLGKEETQAMSI